MILSGRIISINPMSIMSDCIHEKGQSRPEEGAAGAEAQVNSSEAVLSETGKQEPGGSYTGQPEKANERKKPGFVKGFWDSLGDEKRQDGQRKNPAFGESLTAGISRAATALHEIFPHRIVNKWESVREKIKVSASAALKKFSGGKDTFAALTNMGSHKGNGKSVGSGKAEPKKTPGSREEKPDIQTAEASDSHLLDSYTKTGEYCSLKENIKK